LIVVSRTILTTTEKVTEQIKELREAQAATDEKLNILIDTVDRIIRNLGKDGTKQ
jgi:DNA-binding winged helix-turn-helix (wHTH) protein